MHRRRVLPIAVFALLAAGTGVAWKWLGTPSQPSLGPQAGAVQGAARDRRAARSSERPTADRSASAEVAEMRGLYSAPVGRRLAFTQESALEVSMKSPDMPEATGASQRMAGRLEITVVGRRPGEILLDLRLLDTTGQVITGSEQSDLGPLTRELAQVVGVRLEEDGTVLGYRFPECSAATRRMVRSLVASLHFVVPVGAAGEWTAEHADETGRVLCRYQDRAPTLRGRQVERRKVEYLEAEAARDAMATEGQARAQVDAEAGWIAGIELDECLRIDDRQSGFEIRSRAQVVLALQSFEDGVALRPGTPDWDAAESPASGLADADEQVADHALVRQNAQVLLAEVERLQDGAALDHQAINRLQQRLAELLQARPELIGELEARILDESASLTSRKLLLAAIAAADTPGSQALMAEFLQGEALPEELRHAVAMNTLAIQRPTPALRSALSTAWARSEASSMLGRTSLLMLGAAAARADGSALDQLLALEERARERGQAEVWLRALGNAGLPAVVEPAARGLRSEDAGERLAATSALRLVEDSRVAPLLRAQLGREVDPEVRALGARILATRAETQDASLLAQLLDQDSSQVRLSVLRGLGLREDWSEWQALVQRTASSNSDPDVRRAAEQMLGRS